MNEPEIVCPNCGASEEPGALFCSACGRQFSKSGGLRATIGHRPYIAAFIGGIAFAMLGLGVLVLTDSSGPSIERSSTLAGGIGEGSVLADATATPTPESSVAQATSTSTSTAVPTATDVPQTEVIPTETPQPPTRPTGLAIPPEKTSALVGLTVDGGHGSNHQVGSSLTLCYSSLPNQYIRLLDFQPPDTLLGVLREGVDDGLGECLTGTIEPPFGLEVFRIEVLNESRTQVVDYAEVWIRVLP